MAENNWPQDRVCEVTGNEYKAFLC